MKNWDVKEFKASQKIAHIVICNEIRMATIIKATRLTDEHWQI